MLKSSSLFYSVALATFILTAPVTVRAEDSALPSGTLATSPGIAIGDKVDGKIEKHRDHIDTRRAELEAKVDAWKTAHPGEPLPPKLQAHIDRTNHRLDKRDQILDHREDIHNRRVDIHNQAKAVRDDRKALRDERQNHRTVAKEKTKERIDTRKDRRSERPDRRQNRAE